MNEDIVKSFIQFYIEFSNWRVPPFNLVALWKFDAWPALGAPRRKEASLTLTWYSKSNGKSKFLLETSILDVVTFFKTDLVKFLIYK